MTVTVKVRDVMDNKVFTVDAASTVSQAIEKMIKAGVWSLVVEERGMPVGVVTERDILRRCASLGHYPDKVGIRQIMSSPILTIDPDATIGEAMKMLIDKGVRRVYVVEGGKIVGRVTQSGLFSNMLNLMATLASLPHQL